MDKELPIVSNNEVGEDADIRSMIFTYRGKQVMIDADLAILYDVTTSALNQAAKRNEKRFPEDFRFQLSKEEYENLKSQSVISSFQSGYGGRRTLPYAYTEQGISMLASVLHSDIAISTSIKIMRVFVKMRHFITANALMFERISAVELRQLEYQKQADEKFDKIFEYISDHEESNQKIFFDGQIFDAYSLLTDLVEQAKKSIILIDGYVDTDTLDILSKKKSGVTVTIYTYPSAKITRKDISSFNAQYPSLEVKHTTIFHDRFLIIDDNIGYHIGASIKDAGKKCFGINRVEDNDTIKGVIQRAEVASK